MYSRGSDGIPASLRDQGRDPFAGFTKRIETLLVDAVREVQATGGRRHIDAEVLGRAILAVTIAESRHRLELGESVEHGAAHTTTLVARLLM